MCQCKTRYRTIQSSPTVFLCHYVKSLWKHFELSLLREYMTKSDHSYTTDLRINRSKVFSFLQLVYRFLNKKTARHSRKMALSGCFGTCGMYVNIYYDLYSYQCQLNSNRNNFQGNDIVSLSLRLSCKSISNVIIRVCSKEQ